MRRAAVRATCWGAGGGRGPKPPAPPTPAFPGTSGVSFSEWGRRLGWDSGGTRGRRAEPLAEPWLAGRGLGGGRSREGGRAGEPR